MLATLKTSAWLQAVVFETALEEARGVQAAGWQNQKQLVSIAQALAS